MRSLVTFCLLALLGAIAVFLLSNTAPIALTFLGMQSIALPLAVWLAGALLAGGGTGLWFVILFRLAERRGARRERERLRSTSFGPDDFAMVDEGFGSRDFAPAASSYREPGYQDAGYRDAGYEAGYGDRDGHDRDRDYREGGDRGRDYRGGDYSDQGYSDQGYSDQGYSDRDYPDRDYPARDDPAQADHEPVDRPRNQPRAPLPSPQDKNRQGGFVGRYPVSEPEFEAIEVEPPVYDANYRVIQPPAADPARDSGKYAEQSSGKYISEDYPEQYSENDWQSPGDRKAQGDSFEQEPYPAAQASSRPTDSEVQPTVQTTFQTPPPKASQPKVQSTAQQKSQPKDDWDIDADLDW